MWSVLLLFLGTMLLDLGVYDNRLKRIVQYFGKQSHFMTIFNLATIWLYAQVLLTFGTDKLHIFAQQPNYFGVVWLILSASIFFWSFWIHQLRNIILPTEQNGFPVQPLRFILADIASPSAVPHATYPLSTCLLN